MEPISNSSVEEICSDILWDNDQTQVSGSHCAVSAVDFICATDIHIQQGEQDGCHFRSSPSYFVLAIGICGDIGHFCASSRYPYVFFTMKRMNLKE